MRHDILKRLFLTTPEDTDRLGHWFARTLRGGDTLLLEGGIGAGKTHLARAMIQAMQARHGRAEDVPSPTFTLVQTYEAGPDEIWHADLYRVGGPDEVIELGLHDAFGTAICLVEWPDRLGADAPEAALTVRLTPDAKGRHVEFFGAAPWADRLASLAEVAADA
ncbi:tRNA (adenosine(37)-N6)-threonylcarbamoyltransferase complex ATPase subunit type 1 TsaE [Tranquillimonas rosea]|uniref:tRNA (adenosine(37)-N6)-threonylcarbamoyltransferase complex ATPase subunit type 1 TsaE n=1 Tax=Tranquillimonas rosea TaxID=641238 RepID=UPI003BAA3288